MIKILVKNARNLQRYFLDWQWPPPSDFLQNFIHFGRHVHPWVNMFKSEFTICGWIHLTNIYIYKSIFLIFSVLWTQFFCFLLSQTSVSGMFTSGWNILIKEIGFWLYTTAAIYSHINISKPYENLTFLLLACWPSSVIGFPSIKFSVKRAGPPHWYSPASQQIEPSEDIPERQTIFLKYCKMSARENQ